jgi:hypothetical protein
MNLAGDVDLGYEENKQGIEELRAKAAKGAPRG